MLLAVTIVSDESSTEKKNLTFYMNVDIFQKDRYKLCTHVFVKSNESDDDCLK